MLSPSYTFRKEGYTKIIEYDLSSKQKGQLIKKRPDVLLMEKMGPSSTNRASQPRADMDVDESPSEEQDEGEYLGFDSEVEEDESSSPTKAKDVTLPKSASGRVKTKRGRNERVIAPEECRAHLRLLFRNEAVACSLIYGRHGPYARITQDQLCYASADMFFMEVIPVTPTRFRPPAKMGENLFEHPQNELLSQVLKTSGLMRDTNAQLRSLLQTKDTHDEAERRKLMSSLLDHLVQLQVNINSFIDSTKNPAVVQNGKLPPAGIKQILEKKEGLVRKHMMVSISLLFE